MNTFDEHVRAYAAWLLEKRWGWINPTDIYFNQFRVV